MSITINVIDASALPVVARGTRVILVEDGNTGITASFYTGYTPKVRTISSNKDDRYPTYTPDATKIVANTAVHALDWLITRGAIVTVVNAASASDAVFSTDEFKKALAEAYIITEATATVETNNKVSLLTGIDTTGGVFVLPEVAFEAKTDNAGYFANYVGGLKMFDGLRDGVMVPLCCVAAGVMVACDGVGGPWLVPAGLGRASLGLVYGYYTWSDGGYKTAANFPSTDTANSLLSVGGSTFLAGNYANAVNGSSATVGKALSMTNVRRLLVYLLREFKEVSSGILYEFNVASTWDIWKTQVSDVINYIVSGGGIVAYEVRMGNDTMTSDDIVNGIARGRVVLQVPGVVRSIVVDVVLTNSDASFEVQISA